MLCDNVCHFWIKRSMGRYDRKSERYWNNVSVWVFTNSVNYKSYLVLHMFAFLLNTAKWEYTISLALTLRKTEFSVYPMLFSPDTLTGLVCEKHSVSAPWDTKQPNQSYKMLTNTNRKLLHQDLMNTWEERHTRPALNQITLQNQIPLELIIGILKWTNEQVQQMS